MVLGTTRVMPTTSTRIYHIVDLHLYVVDEWTKYFKQTEFTLHSFWKAKVKRRSNNY